MAILVSNYRGGSFTLSDAVTLNVQVVQKITDRDDKSETRDQIAIEIVTFNYANTVG